MNNCLSLSLDSVLRDQQLTPFFQPIISANGKGIFGYEALIRGPEHSPLHSPLARCRGTGGSPDRGGVVAENRQGESVFFPIVSLSLALQHVSSNSHRNSLQIADNLSELKKQAKRRAGNSLAVERRTK